MEWEYLFEAPEEGGEVLVPGPLPASTGALDLGHGLLTPFRHDQSRDLANGTGVALVQCSVAQILGTECSGGQLVGELPWDDEFGSLVHTIKHRDLDEVSEELLRTHVVDALNRWERRVMIRAVHMVRRANSGRPNDPPDTLAAFLVYDVVDAGGVVASNVEQLVNLS